MFDSNTVVMLYTKHYVERSIGVWVLVVWVVHAFNSKCVVSL